METAKHYYAFISHSTSDEKMAKWLRRQLINYYIPTSVQKKCESPKRIRPVFLYQTDLAGTKLGKSLATELSDSKYLIVLCSQTGAKSEYVNEEVEHFIKTGRSNEIIPFILEGTPEESFPPALLELNKRLPPEDEIRGINFPKMSKDLRSRRGPVVNLIASMLGVRFDTLWDIYKRKQRSLLSCIALLVFLLLTVTCSIWYHYKPVCHYYVDFVVRNGVPVGVCPISEEELSEREITYKFSYNYLSFGDKERHLTKVECINSCGYPSQFDPYHPNVDGLLRNYSPVLKINYNDNNQVQSICFCDEKGVPQIKYVYSSVNLNGNRCFIADIVNLSNDYDMSGFVNMEERINRSNVRRILYRTDTNGYVKSITYHANNGNLKESLTTNYKRVYGYEFMLDTLHRITCVTSFNSEGGRMNDMDGVNRIYYEYDNLSNLKSLSYFDKNNKPILCPYNYHKVKCKFDEFGNIIETTTFDEHGNVCISKEGCAIERHKYQKGLSIEDVGFDEKGNRINTIRNKAWKVTKKYDNQGNCVEERFYDTEGNPTNNHDGWSVVVKKYDKSNNCIEQMVYDKNNKPTFSKEYGASKIVAKYDKNGRQIESISYGIDGEKILNRHGFCVKKMSYGKVGNVSLFECFDTKGNRISCVDGYAMMRSDVSVDEYGNQIVSYAFYGCNEDAVMSNLFKSHKCVFVCDECGNLTEQCFYDIENKLFENQEGVAIVRYLYDSRGRMIRNSFYGEDKTPINNINGIGAVETSYPNDTTTITYYKDKDNHLCMSASDVAMFMIVQSGDTVIKTSYNITNNICKNRDGYAISKEVFNKYKLPVAGYYYGIDGKPIMRFDSIAGFNYKYDKRGNVIEVVFFDNNMKIVNNQSGYAITRNKYDERDNCIESSVFDKNNNPCVAQSSFHAHKVKVRYDDRDRVVENNYYDIDTNKTVDPINGFACVRMKYDLRGNCIETTYWDEYGNPTTNIYNIHKEKNDFDDHNNVVLQRFYDIDSSFATLPDGQSAIISQKWNDRKQIIQKNYYDKDSVLIGTEEYQYNQYGLPNKVKRQLANSPMSDEAVLTLFLYNTPDGYDNSNVFLVLEWEKWNILKQVDFYANELVKSRNGCKKKMTIMTALGEIKEMTFDANARIDVNQLPKQNYKMFCERYKQWKKSGMD